MQTIVFYTLCLLFASQLLAESPQPRKEWEMLRKKDLSEIRQIVAKYTVQQKEVLINEIKRDQRLNDVGNFESLVLVLLDDGETISQLGQMVVNGDDPSDNAFRTLWNNPGMKTIAALAPALADESDRSGLIAKHIVEMIRDTPGFSESVYNWANQFHYGIYYHWRLVMWEWWKANKIHFEKGDYLSVKPGALPLHNDEFTIEPTPDGKEIIRLLPAAAGWTPVAPADTPVPYPKSASTPELKSREDLHTRVIRRNYLVPVFILVVLAIGVSAYFTRRRKR